MDETLRDITNKRQNNDTPEPHVPSKRRQSNIDLIARLQSRIRTFVMRLLVVHHYTRYPFIQVENEQLRAKVKPQPAVSDSLSTSRLMVALERENEQLQHGMQQLRTTHREKMAKLESQLAIIGNEPAAKKLIDQIQSLSHQLIEANRVKMRREEEFKERDQLRLNEIDMLKGTIEEMNNQPPVAMEDELETMKTQLENVQQLLNQSNLEKSLLETAKVPMMEIAVQTEALEVDSFFRDLTLTNQPVRADLETLLNEATTLAETFKKERDAFKEKYNEALEDMAFLNDEKQCHNEAVDDLNKENSSLKDQIREVSISSNNNVSMESFSQISALKAEIVDLKGRLESQTDNQNLESMLIQSQKSESVLKLKLDMVSEHLKQGQELLAQVTQKASKVEKEMHEQKVQHKRSADEWKQIIGDLQKELNAAIYGNGAAGRLEHSDNVKLQHVDVAVQTEKIEMKKTVTKLSKSEMEELGIEDDSQLNNTFNDENHCLRNKLSVQAETLERLQLERDTLRSDCEALAATADKLKRDLTLESAQLAEARDNVVELANVRQFLAETEAARASLLDKATANENFLVRLNNR